MPIDFNRSEPVGKTTLASNRSAALAHVRRPYAQWNVRFAVLGLFGIFGLVAVYTYCDMLLTWAAAWGWQPVTATLVRADLVPDPTSATRVMATATYSYSFDGVQHIGSQVFATRHYGCDSVDRLAYRLLDEHLQSGQPLLCYVDPADPTRAVLFRGLRSDAAVTVGLIAMLLGSLMPTLAWLVLFGFRRFRRERTFWLRQQAVYPEEPWLWRVDWVDRSLTASSNADAKAITYLALAWNTLALPTWMIAPAARHGDHYAWGAVALIAVGFGLAVFAIHFWWHTWRTEIQFSALPIEVGGHLTAKATTTALPTSSEGLTLTLRCVKLLKNRQNALEVYANKGHEEWEELPYYEEQVVAVPVPLREIDGVAFDVDFDIPAELPGTTFTDPERNGRVVWLLRIATDPKSKDHVGQFELPVFDSSSRHYSGPSNFGGSDDDG